MIDKKPFVFRTTTKSITDNIRRDFSEVVDKQEMVTVGEMTAERGKKFMEMLFAFLTKCIGRFNDDFIIEVFRHKEIADRKIDRIKFKQRLAVPTPRPGRSYWYYHANTKELEFLWDLPAKDACKWSYQHRSALLLKHPIALKTILDYYDGSLAKRADEINERIAEHRGYPCTKTKMNNQLLIQLP